MQTNDALSRINAIHSMLNSTAIFRGYRSGTTLFSAVLAMLAAVIQTEFIPEPLTNLNRYMFLWGTVAILSVSLSGWHLWKTYRSRTVALERAKYRSALIQLCPGLAAGAGLTLVIANFSAESIWMLPGLWAICFGLAVCSSTAILPKMTLIGGLYFIIAGLAVIACGPTRGGLAPWAMVVTFAVGQSLNAFLLYWTLEKSVPNQEFSK